MSKWVRDRSLTLVMVALSAIFLVGQVLTGWSEYNATQLAHGRHAIGLSAYVMVGHIWEALFENWESEFLQMAAFVTFTTRLYQRHCASELPRAPAGGLANASSNPFA